MEKPETFITSVIKSNGETRDVYNQCDKKFKDERYLKGTYDPLASTSHRNRDDQMSIVWKHVQARQK